MLLCCKNLQVLLWGPLFVGPLLFGRTCWTCLNPPLDATATCPSIRSHCRHLANTIELVHPPAHSSPQSKRQMDRFSRFCTAYGRKCLYFTMGTPIHQNCPFAWKSWTSHVTHDAFGPSPLPSNRHHLSNGDCLEGKGENYRVCSVQYCVQQLCTVQCTHMNRPNSSLDWVLSHWAHFTVLIYFCMVYYCVLYACVGL